MKMKLVKYLVALGMTFAVSCLCVSAQTVQLSNTGHSATVELTGANAGMNNWTVGGGDRLNLQWFYYRIGSGANAPVSSLGLDTWQVTGGNKLSVVYGVGSPIKISIDYTLGIDGGAPDIMEDIHVINTSGGAISGFHFFQYSDFDLSPSDSVYISSALGTPNAYSVATQVGGLTELSESIVSPEAAGAEAGDAALLLSKITTQSGVNLTGPFQFENGDASWAFQWTFNLGSGANINIIKDKLLWVTPVPEPATASLLLLGLAGLMIRRRS